VLLVPPVLDLPALVEAVPAVMVPPPPPLPPAFALSPEQPANVKTRPRIEEVWKIFPMRVVQHITAGGASSTSATTCPVRPRPVRKVGA
jgi:hypothetical protein